jgi:hypothetical protein
MVERFCGNYSYRLTLTAATALSGVSRWWWWFMRLGVFRVFVGGCFIGRCVVGALASRLFLSLLTMLSLFVVWHTFDFEGEKNN